MNLQQTLQLNKKIMSLIAQKHPDPFYLWPNSIEARYHAQLVLDNHKATQALKAGGIAPLIDDQP